MMISKTLFSFQNIFVFILIFYTFLFSNISKIILGNLIGLNLVYSFLPLFFIIIFYLVNFKKNSKLILFLALFLQAMLSINQIGSQIVFSNLMIFIISFLIPSLLVGIKLKDPQETILRVITIYNWIIFANVIYGILDLITQKKLQLFLAQLLNSTHYANSIGNDLGNGVYRLFSPLGHPLTNTLLILFFIVLNISYIRYFNEKTNFKLSNIYLITIIGALLCNSKTGLIIILVILISVFITNKKRLKFFIIMILSGIIVFSTDFFKDNIVKRFVNAAESGDISNGRLTAIKSLMESPYSQPDFFIGGGFGSSNYLIQSISHLNNIEVPLIMFLYDYGILNTFIIYLIIFILPVSIFIIKKHFYLSFLYTMVFIFANTYNGLATGIGIYQMMCFLLMLLLNLSDSVKKMGDQVSNEGVR
ncbi:hypothetical protein AB1K32_21890 [Metabacillus dongyingensis]|uniref:hypothetical protein n=1 Tax=Metabacillus dongyingensis TaxID=2874282 RepID=UPI003B8CA9DD